VREVDGVHAALGKLLEEGLVTVCSLTARRDLDAAEQKVEAARKTVSDREGVERSLCLREVGDEHEVRAVFLLRPASDESLGLGVKVLAPREVSVAFGDQLTRREQRYPRELLRRECDRLGAERRQLVGATLGDAGEHRA